MFKRGQRCPMNGFLRDTDKYKLTALIEELLAYSGQRITA